jgi:hypothetical protein
VTCWANFPFLRFDVENKVEEIQAVERHFVENEVVQLIHICIVEVMFCQTMKFRTCDLILSGLSYFLTFFYNKLTIAMYADMGMYLCR